MMVMMNTSYLRKSTTRSVTMDTTSLEKVYDYVSHDYDNTDGQSW